jgi:Phosphotransferase enzyme family
MTMNFTEQLVEQEEFRVVLVSPYSQMVLVERYDETHHLPRISILKRRRTAEQLSEIILEKWGVRSIVIDLLPKSHELPPCAVVEVRTRNSKFASDELVPVSVDDLDERELTTPERLTVCSIIAGDPRDRGPFSKLGWVEEAQEWIRESVVDHRVEFNEDVRQFSASGFFALVRFGTIHGPAYWLKATCVPSTHEFEVTRTIARYCPEFLPPLIAARTDWNAWVTEEAGQPLHDVLSLGAFEQSTHCLAELQITSAAHIGDLLACGCFDQRMPVLRAHLPALTQYLEEAMARQTSTKVLPLDARRLHELGRLIEEASATMEALDIRDTLIHNDMNPGNILFDGLRAVFTDWSEAGVGNPFLTFQHLQVQDLAADETCTWARQLKQIYLDHWRNLLSESQIEMAFALSPPLAVASYLCGRDPSFTSSHRDIGSVQTHARSLARHMDRFAQAPEFLEALCS